MGLHQPVEGGICAGTRKETAMERLLREGVVGRVSSPSHDINVHGSRKLSEAHIRFPAHGQGLSCCHVSCHAAATLHTPDHATAMSAAALTVLAISFPWRASLFE